MFRSIFTVSGFTLMSRLLGFARDKLIANYLGAGATADVWVAAFRLPNLFRRIFGEGAFNAAFVPMYSRRLEEKGEADADALARRTLSLMFTILMVLFVLAFIYMEWVVKAINVGYTDEDGRFSVAVSASRITVVYLVFICMVAGISGILNSRKIFAAPAFAYVVLNLVFLVGLIFIIPKTGEPILVLSWSVVVAGVLQLAVVLISAKRHGVDLRPRLPAIDDDMKRLGVLMAPGLVSAGIQQLNLLVGGAVASLQVGGQSVIFYADRINQLPLGLNGMAAGVVLLPEITRNLRGGDEASAKRSLCQGMELALLLCLPAMVAMMVIPKQMMYAIFEGGKFTAEAAIESGWVLAAFAIGTPAYVLARVLQPGYFAREDTRTPMRFTIASAVVNMVLAYPMFRWMGPTGCALATSIAGWVNVCLLWAGLRKAGFIGLTPGFFGRVARMFLASCIMGALVWGLAYLSDPWLMEPGKFFQRVVILGVLVALGVAIYFVAVVGTRVYSVAELRSRFSRRSGS